MKKYTYIEIIIVILVAVGSYFLIKVNKKKAIETPVTPPVQASTAVSGGIEKTNPFNVDVNPYQGYKNPFK